MKRNLAYIIVREVEDYLTPLLKIKDDSSEVIYFLRSIGYNLDPLLGAYAGFAYAVSDAVKESINNLKEGWEIIVKRDHFKDIIEDIDFGELPAEIANYPESLGELKELIDEITDLVTSISDLIQKIESLIIEFDELSSIPLLPQFKLLPKRILDALFYFYLHQKNEAILPFLEFATIIEVLESQEITINLKDENGIEKDVVLFIDNLLPIFRYGKLKKFIDDPKGLFRDEYWSGQNDYDFLIIENVVKVSEKFFGRLSPIFEALGLEHIIGVKSDSETLTEIEKKRFKNVLTLIHEFFDARADLDNYLGVTIGFLVDEKTNDESFKTDKGPGIFLLPFGAFEFEEFIRNWRIKGDINLDSGGVKITKTGLSSFSNVADLGSGELKLLIEKHFPNGNKDKLVIGSPAGTRLELSWPFFVGQLQATENSYDFQMQLHLVENSLVISPSSSDGFINKLSDKELRLDFDTGISFSKKSGFHFVGALGLETIINIDKKLFNTIHLKTTELKFELDGRKVALNTTLSFRAKIKPITFSVKKIGLSIKYNFPIEEQKGGFNIDFVPPSGMGLLVKTKNFSGEGFLEKQEKRYIGVLQVNFKNKINLTAIGILDTELPNEKDGYSLLIMIMADGFTPIQLGMGFMLSGVGGLLALNRTMSLPALKKGIKEDSLDKILFPTNPLINYETIVQGLDEAFPVAEKRFVFGPMAQIQWGSPKPILQIELGLFIAIPSPILIGIPGVLKSILPKEDSKKLSIKVNFLGSVDFEKKMIAFDATIFDSRIMDITLSGDIAFRLKWGKQPYFLLSIGGFHPKAPVPPIAIDKLDTLKINLVDKKSAKVSLQAYFAITSNTVQIGAKLDASFKALGYTAIGKLQFDLLFQFNPFRFFFDLSMSASVQNAKGEEKIAIYIDVSVEGPSPWYIVGRALFKIIVEIPINVDLTFGNRTEEDATLPNIEILPQLKEALKNPINWVKEGLPDEIDLIKIHVPADSGDLVLPPSSNLRIRQDIVPLDETIQKVGNAKTIGHNSFKVVKVWLENNTNAIPLTYTFIEDYFSRGNFFNLSDEEKLTSPSFELFANGIQINLNDIGDGLIVGEAQSIDNLEYEEITIDEQSRRKKVKVKQVDYEHLILSSTVSFSQWSQAKRPLMNRKNINKVGIVKKKKALYSIVKNKDLTLADPKTFGLVQGSKQKLLDELGNTATEKNQYQVLQEYDVAVVSIKKKRKIKPTPTYKKVEDKLNKVWNKRKNKK